MVRAEPGMRHENLCGDQEYILSANHTIDPDRQRGTHQHDARRVDQRSTDSGCRFDVPM